MSTRDLLGKKIQMKRINATREDLEFYLSKQDVETLLNDAGITVEDWSFMGYHLSRYNDEGHYTVGNCRFVPYQINYAEKKISLASRNASSKNIAIVNMNKTWQERSEADHRGGLVSGGMNKLSAEELVKRHDLVKHIDLSGWGSITKAAKILGISHTHVGRLRERWKELNLL